MERQDGTSASSTELPEGLKKNCKICNQSLCPDAFYATYRTVCKKCVSKKVQQNELEKKRAWPEMENSDESVEFAATEEYFPDSLYIMENPRIPGEIKIGRSHNPEERAKQLSAGNNFRIVVRRSYGEKGFLEKTLHQRLKCRRVQECAGIEWFKVSVDQAEILIRAAILEDELSKFSA